MTGNANQLRLTQEFCSLLGRAQVITVLLLVGLISPVAVAQTPYRLNGLIAPQVVSDPLAARLEEQLRTLREQLRSRSRQTNLEQAMEAGLLNNPDLARAYALIQGQQWNLISVRRQWYPSLIANSDEVPGQAFSTTVQSGQGPSNTTTYRNSTGKTARLLLSWTFFNSSRGANINAASESLKRQQLLFDVSARQLVLDIQTAYFNLQEQALLIEAYEDILASTTRQVRTTEAQFNSGLNSIADVEQIRTQQLSTLTILINAYRQLIDAASLLAQTMALPPGTLALPSTELMPLGRWDEPLQTTIDQALALREEIQASLAAAASASWSATALFNNYWPRFSLGTFGRYADQNATIGLPGAAATSANRQLNWEGGVSIGFNWTLFDGGVDAARAEQSLATARAEKDRAEQQRLQVSREVEQSYSNYLTSLLAQESTQAQARAARVAAVAVQERFAVGVTDMASVVQTLNEAIRAASAYASAVRTYNTAVADLYRSSARWPSGSQPLLQQRVDQLKKR